MNCLCAVTIVVVMLVFTGLRIQDTINEISTSTTGNNEMTTHVNYFLEYFLLLVSGIAAYVYTYYYRYKIVNVLNAMAAAWLQLPVTQKCILEDLRLKIILYLIFLLILLILRLAINYTRREGSWIMIVATMIFILPQIIQFLSLTAFYVLVLMLVALLTNIEEALKTFTNQRVFHKSVESVRKVETNTPTVLNLRSIELVYVKAFEIKRVINEAFQATILLSCVQCFHATVSESHLIYHGIFVVPTMTTHEIINYSFWVLYQFIKMYVLADAGNLLKAVVKR